MSSPSNFSFSASTRGSDQGSGNGPFGLGGAAGAAGFGGGGGTAAAGATGLEGGAADSFFGLLISSATTQLIQVKKDETKPRDSNTSIATMSTAYHSVECAKFHCRRSGFALHENFESFAHIPWQNEFLHRLQSFDRVCGSRAGERFHFVENSHANQEIHLTGEVRHQE